MKARVGASRGWPEELSAARTVRGSAVGAGSLEPKCRAGEDAKEAGDDGMCSTCSDRRSASRSNLSLGWLNARPRERPLSG
jgi:hypothetical protein